MKIIKHIYNSHVHCIVHMDTKNSNSICYNQCLINFFQVKLNRMWIKIFTRAVELQTRIIYI